MINLPLTNSVKFLKNKKILERELGVNLDIKKSEIFIEGNSEDEFIAQQVINAFDFGFDLRTAFLIKKDDLIFEVLRIKDYTKKKNLESVRSRIIGIKGKTLRTLTELSDCFFELNMNEIGIIGMPENIKKVNNSIISLIRGSKQANVYRFLEKHRSEIITDFGLKEKSLNKSKKQNK
jgi:KH domain-containing protein